MAFHDKLSIFGGFIFLRVVCIDMTLVESCTIEGELYEYDGLDGRILLSPFGAFEIDKNGRFRGPVVAFQAYQLGDERECIDESFSMDAYMVDESLFIPLNEVTDYHLGRPYVINGKNLVTLGNAEFLRPELLDGEQSNEQVIEVYTHAFPRPHSVEDRMEADLVHQQTVAELFEENTVEIVQPI